MKEALVSGLNDWLLNTSPKDSRYADMEALRDTIQSAVEDSDLLATVEEYKATPKPVARGFAFDFLFNEAQENQILWVLENVENKHEMWRQIIKILFHSIEANKDAAIITYGESGGPYGADTDETE